MSYKFGEAKIVLVTFVVVIKIKNKQPKSVGAMPEVSATSKTIAW
jgi:hypothetical protein